MRGEKKFILSILAAVILLSLISCRGAFTGDPQTRLKERVEGYIEARKAGDQIALQAFYLDPHQAKVGNIRYLNTKIVAIEFSDDDKKARVQLKNEMKAMGFTFKDTPQSTEWVWQKGDWYQVVNPNKNPFTRPANQLKKSSHVDAQK
jgi:hypothetical protein